MKTTMTITPLRSNTTMTGTQAHMLVRMADAIGARIMGTTAALMSGLTGESITTGMQCHATAITAITTGLTSDRR
jgi:hypothetical protein